MNTGDRIGIMLHQTSRGDAYVGGIGGGVQGGVFVFFYTYHIKLGYPLFCGSFLQSFNC